MDKEKEAILVQNRWIKIDERLWVCPGGPPGCPDYVDVEDADKEAQDMLDEIGGAEKKKALTHYKLCRHLEISTDDWSFEWCRTCGAIKFLANQRPVEKDVKKISWNLPEWKHKY